MIFTSIPDNYDSVNKPLLYQFECDELREMVDVKIVDVIHIRTLGIRRFYNVQSAEIDVAPYLKNYFALNPIVGGISLADADGLYVAIVVEIDNERSAERYFSQYPVTYQMGALFTKSAKSQTLSRAESDYVVIYAPSNGGTLYCELHRGEEVFDSLSIPIEPKPGLQLLKIMPEELDERVDSMIVELDIEGEFNYLNYRIRPKSDMSKRLMWLDADGMVQLYTFPMCRARRRQVEKQRIESEQGIIVTACKGESILELVSDYEAASMMEDLDAILESRYVFLDRGADSVKVDVLSTENVVRYGGELNSIMVEIRPCCREEVIV